MTLHEKWEHSNHRLRMLDAANQEEEAGLLSEAYERLICAYQEAREINDKLEFKERFHELTIKSILV